MMKVPRFFRHKKIWAATARRSPATTAGMEFEEMPEPNMKLSRALLIVLLLHVVAVSGIIAFNAIKNRESSFVASASANTDAKPPDVQAAARSDSAKPRTTMVEKQNAPAEDVKPSHSPSKSSSKDDHPKALSLPKTAAGRPLPSGKTYVVKKGDNPVTIAKKLKVPYDDLIALNHIEDPRKLQIGQKLLIPKTTKSKTTNGKTANPKEKKNEVRHAKQQERSA